MAEWYVCQDRGGAWPVMLGPYPRGEAIQRAARLGADAWVVGLAGPADRGDYLRRWEDARAVPGARAAIVARLRAALWEGRV